jgi:RNA polymerase sigma factor (sigma-70 family)
MPPPYRHDRQRPAENGTVDDELLAQRFEAERSRLRSVAYRVLGSPAEADDAVQEAWLRLRRSGADGVDNLAGWLTTVVGRVCLDMLRTKRSRREQALDTTFPEPVVSLTDDPEQQALRADAVGLALLVVLRTLEPAERLAFVLHDLFAVPFDEIAPIVDRTPAAARQLASRARRRVQEAAPAPERDLASQHRVVDAFLAAAREGDFAALLAILDPDIVLRVDAGAGIVELRGADHVGRQAFAFPARIPYTRPAFVNGTPGLVAVRDGELLGVMGFTVVDGRVVALDILADPGRLHGIRLLADGAER